MAEKDVSVRSPAAVDRHTCAVCEEAAGLKACGSCTQVWYCSREHQVEDWRNHKLNCKKILSEDSEVDPDGEVLQKMTSLTMSSQTECSSKNRAALSNLQNITAELSDQKIPPGLPSHVTTVWLEKTAADIATCLKQFGIAVINNFLGTGFGERVLQEAQSLHTGGEMTDGQTISTPSGSGGESNAQQKYRTDKIAWVHGTEANCTYIGKLIRLMDSVVNYCKGQLPPYTIKGRTQAMVACYPGNGTHYMRHIDNPNKDGRILTCIYYLNAGWNSRDHGGMLKIYPEGSTRIASIEPLFDRLLVFWSDRRNPHEVLPAYRTRYAVTVWYFDANERSQAVANQMKAPEGKIQSDNDEQTYS